MRPKVTTADDGLGPIGPLRGPVSSVRVALRPVDPLIDDRLSDLFSECRPDLTQKMSSTSVAIRSVDGFFVNIGGKDPVLDGPALVRVIDFDPMKGLFLTVGDGEPDPEAQLYWYVFRAFEDTGIVFTMRDKEYKKDEERRDRESIHEERLGLLRAWKTTNVLTGIGIVRFRCAGLEDLKAFLMDQVDLQRKSQRS